MDLAMFLAGVDAQRTDRLRELEAFKTFYEEGIATYEARRGTPLDIAAVSEPRDLLADVPRSAGRARICGLCRQPGHNAQTCGRPA